MAEYRKTDINNGSKVKFLLGTQNALEPYIAGTSSAANGTFYLTNDTHRLYVGNKDGKAVPVNEGVITVKTLAELESTYSTAHPGEFFYVTTGNILCVCAGEETTGNKKFVQINNNTDTYVQSAKTEISLADSVATLTQTYIYNQNGETSDTFQIAADGGISVSVTGTKVTLTGTTNSGLSFDVTSDGVQNTATATLNLTDSKNNTVSANIKSTDSTLLNLTKDTDGKTLILTPKDQSVTGVNVAAIDDGNGFNITVTNHNGQEVSNTVDPKITYGASKNQTVSFTNGVAILDVYTKGEVDALERALNAMTYKGLTRSDTYTGSDVNDIPAWSVIVNNNNTTKIGDTYLFVDSIKVSQTGSSENETTYSKGTLAIAKTSTGGEDSTTGYLLGTIDWDYVQSSVDTDTTYRLSTNTTDKNVQLTSNVNDSVQGIIAFADGALTTADVTSTNSGKNATVKFNHNTVARNDTTSQNAEQNMAGQNALRSETTFTAVNGITTDGYGHITAVNTQQITLKDTIADPTNLTGSVSVDSGVATLSSILAISYGDGTEKELSTSNLYQIASETLALTANGNNLTIDLTWGSF